MSNIRLKEDTHEYWIDDLKGIGVSDILSSFGIGNYDKVPDRYLIPAANFGKAGHNMARYHIQGRLNEETLSPKLFPYLVGLKKLLIDHKIEPIDIEKPIGYKTLLICGTPDNICMFDGIKTDLEWKFVKVVQKASQLQSGGYQYIYNANIKEPDEEIKQGKIIQLIPNGYNIIDVGFDVEQEFENLLLAWHIRRAYR